MMPSLAFAMSSGLTSETINGTSGFIRQADELSITIVPCLAYFSAIAREVVAPAEKIAISRSLVSAVEASSTSIF